MNFPLLKGYAIDSVLVKKKGDSMPKFAKRCEVAEQEWLDDSEAQREYQEWLDEVNSKVPQPREIDLMQPMVCIVSVKVTDEMIENGTIPF